MSPVFVLPGPAPDHYNGRMTRRLTATETKARILALLDDVEGGEEVEITRHGRTVARLVPARGPNALKASLAGVAMTVAAEDRLFATGAAWKLR
jgi:prevent-host-death family protein